MSTSQRPRRTSSWLFRLALRAFPVDFRADHGRAMEQTFHAQQREAHQQGDRTGLVRLWLDLVRDVCTTAPREHISILKHDVSYACRALRRAPVFTVSAVLTLALGMSAMSGMFAIVNAVMFRPLPVDHPEQLISISYRTGSPFGLSFLALQEYRSVRSVLTDAIGYAPRPGALTSDDGTERIGVEVVTDNYFTMLGVQPATGRLIQPNEGRARGDAPVMVLAHDYWRARFRGDRSIVGRTVRLNGRPFTVIGVAAETFRDTESLVSVAAYIPAWMLDDLTDRRSQSTLDDRGARAFTVLGRLNTGVSLSQARAALEARAAALARDYPATHADVALRVVPETHTRPTPELGSFLRVAATALAGLAALLLLITSANLANLFFARAANRGREVALRSALGARRGRIVRQFLTESAVLAVAATAVAVPIAVLAMRSLNQFLSSVSAMATFDPDFSLDAPVIATTVAVAITAALVSGLGPSLSVCRSDPGDSLKSGGRGAAGGSPSKLRSALVVAQVALSLALLVSGALFVRSLDRARAVDLGLDPNGLLLARAEPGLQGYDAARRLVFYRTVRDLVMTLPGVQDAAWISFPPLGIVGDIAAVAPVDRPPDPRWRPPIAYEYDVSPEYFTTARVALVDGRTFNQRDDTTATPVVIVNETLARQFWGTRSPIGRGLTVDGATFEIVGVVRDGKYRNVGESPEGAVFKSLAQAQPRAASLTVRTGLAPAELAASVRQAIRQVDSEVAVYDVRSMTEHLDNGSAFFVYRLGAFITSLFGAMGVLLASIGLYGMVAYHVAQRTQEFGVRMAVGASATDIVREVLARGGCLAAIGTVIGVVLAAGLSQLLRGLLLDVSPLDPIAYVGVSALVVAVCLVASFVPARRATRADPLVALRSE